MSEVQERGEEREQEQEQERRDGDGDEDGGLSLGGRSILSASPLIWVLLAGAVIWAVWATVTRSSSSSGAGMRALVVPTAGADRMVVALPCSALGGGSKSMQGGASVLLPAGSGQRVVLVPGCQGGGSSGGASSGGGSSGGASGGGSSGGGSSGGSSGSGTAAVVVLAPGTPLPRQGGKAPSIGGSGSGSSGGKLRSLFDVPAQARVVIVAPCQGKGSSSSSSTAAQPPAASGHGVLLAPACG
jgi:hypothetical protein